MENVIVQGSPLAYSIRDFCEAVSISPRTFYTLQERGEGPAITRVGGRVLIRTGTAHRWLEEREARTAA